MTDMLDPNLSPPRRRRPFGATGWAWLVGCAGASVLAVLALAMLGGAPALGDDWAGGIVAAFGPLAVVVLLAVAVVASPIPSGPVAMAAGALYGPWIGGCLTAAGAFAGAMIAFGLSRRFGRGALSGSSSSLAVWMTRPRSQPMLMAVILVSRLVPFISFDAVSYIAGLTPIEGWRFALATLVGSAPVCFAFAAMGAGMTQGGSWQFAAAACGVTLIVPALALAASRARAAWRARHP